MTFAETLVAGIILAGVVFTGTLAAAMLVFRALFAELRFVLRFSFSNPLMKFYISGSLGGCPVASAPLHPFDCEAFVIVL